MRKSILCLLIVALTSVAAIAATPTVVFDQVATKVTAAPSALLNPDNLWITLEDLKRATGFVVKPQGICRGELCFPIPKARRNAFLSKQGRVTWFNLSEFARLTKQPAAMDKENALWYFGPRPAEQNGYVESLIAPDFTLPDINGQKHSLSDYRGKKVLLITWASW